jgi:hypothetical protein
MFVLISIAIVGFMLFSMGLTGSQNLYYGTLNEVDDLALRTLNYGVAGQVPKDFRRLYTRVANGDCAFRHGLLSIALTSASLFLFVQLPLPVFAEDQYDLRSPDLIPIFVFSTAGLWISARAYFLRRRWLKASDKEIIDWLKKKGREIKTTGKRAPWPPPQKG